MIVLYFLEYFYRNKQNSNAALIMAHNLKEKNPLVSMAYIKLFRHFKG